MVSETKEDLGKFTIPQLKEKLKQRRLQISGTKNELINRLFESLQEEELLGEGASVAPSEIEEELLGNNDSNSAHLTTKDEDLLLGLEVNKSTKEADPKFVENQEIQKVNEDGDKKSEQAVDTEQSRKRPSIAAPEGALKKEETFTTDAKARRAARFGLAAETEQKQDSNGNSKEKKPEIKTSDPKLLARAKRFGLAIGSADSSPAKVAKPSVEDDEKLKARRIRFGL
ncbi:unnamed protein product [Bursaphelenchus xylophilus]|uniref:(pine wood nematode) hypothetical protein n=1 Tax=Bursaphelenchus xylophilus TaxID=6326 RepID=A0A1I7ST36_BURXY|nr:unnamed protein product [Bursaphelenchus xylophilus]CAG9108757.1 unnamed protein product [Bursaphelenchus xylophilus]